MAVSVILLTGCNKDPHFITNRTYRNQVHDDFLLRQQLAQGRADFLFAGMDTLSRRDREAMEFLYAYMPYSDLADYDQAFFLQQVRTAFAARDTFSWGRQVPEDIFRHFVLVYRVNNENLDSARMVFFRELKERVKGLTMEQAALEVNHWCHEHVAYRGADARTSAPLATMRTSLGRCGEESTFAVTALRAVGIPARQCYTPRWAHCDDNHAWVEVWIANEDGKGGEWKFLGACEPDPELNMGWFAVPSTRCMMVHSKAFGRYHGDEEVVRQTALYSELNLLSHYAPTRHVTVTVVDMNDKHVEGAKVSFKLYNYSEYYTLATYESDAKGQAGITTGLGDLLVWATDGKHYNYCKLDVRKDSVLTIALSRECGGAYVDDIDIVPPVEGVAKVTPDDNAVAANAKRIAYEDSLRSAYTATFPTQDNYMHLIQKPDCSRYNFTDAQLWELIQKSEGNYAQLIAFINRHICSCRSFDHIYDYLKSFSDKDLRDVPTEIFEAQLTGYDVDGTTRMNGRTLKCSYEVYRQGIMPARISNELVRDWRKPLAEALKDVKDVSALKAWTLKNIAVDDTGNYYNCPISPMGVYQLRYADAHSRDIFFVAACRALVIPAYLDNATNTIYVWNGNWEKVSFEEETPTSATATLRLEYHGKDPKTPIYYPHFTLQKFVDGDFVTFDFEEDPRMAQFPATLQLEPGYYCLSTGNRYPEGDVLNRMEFFVVEAGQTVTKEIVLRPLVNKGLQFQGKISNSMEVMDGITLREYAGETGIVLAFLGTHREPSKHLVKEMLQHKDSFRRWGGMIYATTTDPGNKYLHQLGNVDIVPMEAGKQDFLECTVSKELKMRGYEYPLVAVVDKEGNILFHSAGYKIGLAEDILRVLQ